MPVYCTNHPHHYAAFNCPKCHANLCPSCITKKKNQYYGYTKDVYLCPKCTTFVNKLSFKHAIEPFWKRLPSIFQYPFHLQPIVLMIALSLILTLFAEKSLTGLIAFILYFGIILTYACLALASSANGRLTPPPISFASIVKNFGLFFKQMGLYILISFLGYEVFTTLLPYLGVEPTYILFSIFSYILLLLLPAMIIVLAVTRSFFSAIMPQAFFLLAWRIGWPYLALNFFLTILLSAPFELISLIADTLPRHALVFISTFLFSYYMVVAYHLMGYILFQYHEQAGYNVDYEGDFHSTSNTGLNSISKMIQPFNPNEELLNKVNLMIREGNYDSAIIEIQQSTPGVIQDPVLAERYYNLLHLRKMAPELIAFAPDYIRLMHKTNEKDKICAAYLFCINIRADFLDDDPVTLYSVGKILYENNYHMDALKIFDRFVRKHDDHSMTPNSYFLIARIFNEHLNDPVRASKILLWLDEKYPFHENAAFVQSYAKRIKA